MTEMKDEQVYTLWIGNGDIPPYITHRQDKDYPAELYGLYFTTKGKKSDWNDRDWPPVEYQITIRRNG